MKTDIIAEMLVGQKGAIRTVGKLITVLAIDGDAKEKTLVFGIVVDELNEGLGPDYEGMSESMSYQLWEGEFIFMPQKIYQGRKDNAEGFADLSVDQILSSTWGRSEHWREKIFDINEKQ